MSKPAARSDDVYACPQHGGATLLSPTSRVRINGRDAARAGDGTQCRVGTDVIATGSGTVKIGSMPAARNDDTTSHGGILELGSANVKIGGPSVAAPGIRVLIENAGEIAKLRERIRVRKEKLEALDRALHPGPKPRWKEFAEQGLKERDIGPRDYWSEPEGIERGKIKQRKEVDDIGPRVARDEARIKDLEAENEARRAGKARIRFKHLRIRSSMSQTGSSDGSRRMTYPCQFSSPMDLMRRR